MRPFLSHFQIAIPPQEKTIYKLSYDDCRMVLMVAGRPAIEQPELLREPGTKTTFVAQETTDDNWRESSTPNLQFESRYSHSTVFVKSIGLLKE